MSLSARRTRSDYGARDGGTQGFEPTLKVTTIDAGEAVDIRVRDNGTGIPGQLFEPFFTTKPTGEGTGFGLSTTYDIGYSIARRELCWPEQQTRRGSELTRYCCRATRDRV